MEKTSEKSLLFIKPQKVYIYEHVLLKGVRHAFVFGGVGGLLTGLVLQFIAEPIFRKLLTPPQIITEGTASLLILAELSLPLIGLVIALLVLGGVWKAPSSRAQYMTGAGVGLIFALVVYSTALGGISGIIANRMAFIFLSQRSFTDVAATYLLDRSVYLVIAEGYGLLLLMVSLWPFAGAILSGLLLKLKPDANTESTAHNVRDVIGALVLVILPPVFFVIFIANTVVYVLLEQSLMAGLNKDGHVFAPTIPIMMIVAGPALLGQLITQLGGVLWLVSSNPNNLHRNMLRFAQVVYGLTGTVGLILALLIINPSFLRTVTGVVYAYTAVILTLIFIMFAQNKLWLAKHDSQTIRIEITPIDIFTAGWGIVLLGGLIWHSLVRQVLFNIFAVTQSLRIAATPDYSITLDGILSQALRGNDISLLLGCFLLIIATSIPLAAVAWAAAASERRYARLERQYARRQRLHLQSPAPVSDLEQMAQDDSDSASPASTLDQVVEEDSEASQDGLPDEIPESPHTDENG